MNIKENPFKEEWLKDEDRLKFIELNKKKLERSKIGLQKYEKESKRSQSNL